MNRRLAARAAPIAAFALWATGAPTPALAAGIEYPDNGTIAIGRGGAWAAHPVDGLAFQYNPAGLAQQRGLRLTLDARLAQQRLRFTSTSLKGDPIENSEGPFLGPSGAVSYGLGAVGPLSELTVALGATGPSSIGKMRFPRDGVQRYALRSTDYFIGFYSLAAAAGVGDWLRLGATFQLAHGSARFAQAVWSDTFTGDNPAMDAHAEFSGENGWQPTGVIGVTVLPHRDWAIGASWRPALRFAAPGKLTTIAPEAVKNDTTQVGDQAELRLAFADIVRVGAQWRPRPRWEVEIDAVWERWSVLEEIRVHTIDVHIVPTYDKTKKIPIPDIVFPHHFHDTWSARVGGEHELIADRLTLRAGYLYETSAAPSRTVSVDFPNWGRHVASAGASIGLFGAWIDLAVAHHFVATQTVSDSVVDQKTSPSIIPGLQPPKPMIVGNGTYEASLTLGSIAVRVPFDALRGALW